MRCVRTVQGQAAHPAAVLRQQLLHAALPDCCQLGVVLRSATGAMMSCNIHAAIYTWSINQQASGTTVSSAPSLYRAESRHSSRVSGKWHCQQVMMPLSACSDQLADKYVQPAQQGVQSTFQALCQVSSFLLAKLHSSLRRDPPDPRTAGTWLGWLAGEWSDTSLVPKPTPDAQSLSGVPRRPAAGAPLRAPGVQAAARGARGSGAAMSVSKTSKLLNYINFRARP